MFSADGNHSLHKKTNRGDSLDSALTENQSYITAHSKMQPYLETKYKRKRSKKKTELDEDEPPVSVMFLMLPIQPDEQPLQEITCSGFKVARSQRPGKFKALDVSGIIAVVCSHLFFWSGAVVDMQTGEM